MSMNDFYQSDMIDLFTAWEGHLQQKRDDVDALRVLVCEQTMNLMNISGKVLKQNLEMADFGYGDKKQMTEEEFQRKVNHANTIDWKV